MLPLQVCVCVCVVFAGCGVPPVLVPLLDLLSPAFSLAWVLPQNENSILRLAVGCLGQLAGHLAGPRDKHLIILNLFLLVMGINNQL